MLVHIVQNILSHKIQVTFTVESLYLKLGLLWFYDHSYFVVTHFSKALTVLVLRVLWTLVPYFLFISKLNIFPLMCGADKACTTEFTLIHKNIRSVRNSHSQVYRSIKVITKLPNSKQSYKGKVKTHNYINRQNQSTTGKLWKP